MVQVINLKCSNCGDSLAESQTTCESCGMPVVIKHMSSIRGLTPQELNKRGRLMSQEAAKGGELSSAASFTAGCCFLQLKLYEPALSNFEKAFSADMDNAEAYFYAAVSILKGRRPFLVPLADLRKAEEFVGAALMIDDRPLFHYLLAYVKFDFYAKKFLRVQPDWKFELQRALSTGIKQDDQFELFELLGQDCPREVEL